MAKRPKWAKRRKKTFIVLESSKLYIQDQLHLWLERLRKYRNYVYRGDLRICSVCWPLKSLHQFPRTLGLFEFGYKWNYPVFSNAARCAFGFSLILFEEVLQFLIATVPHSFNHSSIQLQLINMISKNITTQRDCRKHTILLCLNLSHRSDCF